MTEQKFSYFQAFLKSLYSKEVYRDVIKHWRGMGFVYLLLVTFSFQLLWGVSNFALPGFQEKLTQYHQSSPSYDSRQVTHETPKGEVTKVNRVTVVSDDGHKQVVNTSVVVHKSADGETVHVSKIKTEKELAEPSHKHESSLFLIGLYIVILPFLALVGTVIGWFVSLLITVFAKFIAIIMGVEVGFKALMRMVVVIFTPFSMINYVLGLVGVYSGFFHPLLFFPLAVVIYLGYIIFGLRSLKA